MADDDAPPRYRFGPLERRGLVAGWRGGQIAVVAGGLAVAVAVLRMRPSATGAVVSFAVVAVAVVVATWPVGGRTTEQWAPDAARHAATTVRQHRHDRQRPLAGIVVRAVELDPGSARAGSPVAAVIDDRAQRTYSAVLAVSGPGFVLLGAGDKARRVAAWSTALASLARQGSAVHRLQWIETTLPDDRAEMRRHLTDGAVVGPDADPYRSYAALLDGAGAAPRHEVLLAVTIHAGRCARAVKAAGGGGRGGAAVVVREAASVARRLVDADVTVDGLLSPEELEEALRRRFGEPCPAADRGVARRRPSSGSTRRCPTPMGMRAEWGRLRADAAWHATFWIAEWPRTDVGADFLAPLLLCAEVRRSVSVVMEPVAPLQAARRIEQARTADIADAELRRRGGFLATARRRREEEILTWRESELADGHASYRFSGYVTVAAGDVDALEEACGRIEQAAGQAGLELRRCYGDQAAAFACTLPFGRGLS